MSDSDGSPSGTTASTAGPAHPPLSPQDARGKPPQSRRSGGWRRTRLRSGCQPGAPKPPATLNRQPANPCRPEKPPRPPRLLPFPRLPRSGFQMGRSTNRMGPLRPLKPVTPQPPLCRQGVGPALQGPTALRRAGRKCSPRAPRRAGRAPGTALTPFPATPT